MSRKLILIVEDSPQDEALILRALARSTVDADIHVARDGEQALDYLFATGDDPSLDRRQPDLILLDLRLPKVDGLELLGRIRTDSRTRLIPVVMLSSSTQADDIEEAYLCGANSYLQKAINPDRFLEVVSKAGVYWLAVNDLHATPQAWVARENTDDPRAAREPASVIGSAEAERARMQRMLREEERTVLRRIESLQEFAICMLDRDGKVMTWNAGAERFSGYRGDEIIGKSFALFYSPEAREAAKLQRDLAASEREGRTEDEGWRIRKDGARFWASVVITPMRDPPGRVVGFSHVTRDITERRKATEQFRLAIEAAPTGMLMVDREGKLVLVNAQIESLFGYPREELLGQSIEVLVPQRFRARHPGFRKSFSGDPRARAMGGGRELYGLRKDGTEFPVEIGLNPLQTSDGDFVLSSVVDITERKRADLERDGLTGQLRSLNAELEARVRDRTSQLSATLKEREVLLQEIHHRVKNNLQVISSLINLQVRQVSDVPTRAALQECQTRVQAIALIHEKLYQSTDYSRVPFSEYSRSLAANIFEATGVSPAAIALNMNVEPISLAVDKAIPCGLIMNELITNALKHAFPMGREGAIQVELRKPSERQVLLSVSDDGIGLRDNFDIEESSSLGMQLVSTLVEQLDGHLEMTRQIGTNFTVTFPVEA
jgi:PAS domain S-box-containing protein